MKNYNALQYAIVLMLALLLSACQQEYGNKTGGLLIEGSRLIDDPGLRELIVDYYTAEKNGEWEKTYQLRPVEFRRIVPLHVYTQEMQTGNSGWELIKIEVLGVPKRKNGTVIVEMEFYEHLASEAGERHFSGKISEGVVKIKEATVWRREDDQWRSVDAGQRGHLPLNGELVRQ